MTEQSDKPSLPTHPRQRPRMDFEHERDWIREVIVTLSENKAVRIEYEADECDCDVGGGRSGTWTVEISGTRRTFKAESDDFLDALWYVTEHVHADNYASFEAWESKRQAALNKLSQDDKRLLGLK